eukprot:GHUV01031824.1.p1 GENE.GHUV01031824.1~~GHUV01031824.1.p1  ORF type:complete len:146 (+),score=19.86 GHUV01031824.1:56-493(+)
MCHAHTLHCHKHSCRSGAVAGLMFSDNRTMLHIIMCDVLCLQAYGHAVMNECPFAAITTGKVTHFLRRSLTDPTDSTVWVSPPVSFEGEAVPPLAAWLHLLNLAQSHALQPDGTKRPGWPRERVPVPTQNGYKLVLGGRAVKVGK